MQDTGQGLGAPVPAAHKTSHENGGSDELSVAGLSGVLADPQPPIIGSGATEAVAGNDARLSDARSPTAHKTSHQNNGSDEISVAGLSGELADPQPPKTHATSHQNSGSDEISVAGLSGELADPQPPKLHASSHQHSGLDEVATSLPGPNSIPKSGVGGELDKDWLPVMVGDSGSGGSKGAVPAPASGDASKFLKGDGTWSAGGSGAPTDAQYLVGAAHSGLSAEIVVTAAGLAILDDANAAAQRTTLGAAGSGAITGSGLTMSIQGLAGRQSTPPGAIEEITVGGGLDMTGSVLSTTAWRTTRKTSDQTGIDNTPDDITGLSVSVLNGQTIRFRIYLVVTSSATGIGAMASVNGPSISAGLYRVVEWTSAVVQAYITQTALDSYSTRTAGPGATPVLYEIHGFLTFSADGTFVPRIKAESGGTCSVLNGSWIEYLIA